MFRAIGEIAETIRVSSENTGRTLRAALLCLIFTVMVIVTAVGVAYSIVTVIGPR